jgi:hypothetical protein
MKRRIELSPSAESVLIALVVIENKAILHARLGGCQCNALVPETDRYYPYAVFNSAEARGKPFDQIPWQMLHEPGCPMDGQKGVG